MAMPIAALSGQRVLEYCLGNAMAAPRCAGPTMVDACFAAPLYANAGAGSAI